MEGSNDVNVLTLILSIRFETKKLQEEIITREISRFRSIHISMKASYSHAQALELPNPSSIKCAGPCINQSFPNPFLKFHT